MPKHRIPIPDDLAAEVQFAADRTCCVCRERGKATQVHHIDENPSNNTFESLAVLCFECHNKTQIKGGFGRKLSSSLVTRYRDEWLKDVVSRRDSGNKKDVERQAGKIITNEQSRTKPRRKVRRTTLTEPPLDYIDCLPEFRLNLLRKINKRKSNGSTLDIVQANSEYIDALTGILETLAKYYSPECFEGLSPQNFFAEMIFSRFRLHSVIAEPEGPGTGGTIISIRCTNSVITDVEKMIEDMILGLLWPKSEYDEEDWQKRWRNTEIE